MSKKCIYCGAELEDDALFCDECGKKQELFKEAETEQNAPKDAELKAKQEADAKANAEAAQRAKEEAEKQEQEAAEAKVKLEAEKQAKAEEEARKEKEIRIKAEAEARVRVEAEQKERAAAQEKAEKKAAEEAEAIRLEKERKKEERKANPTYKAYASLILGILIWITFMMGAAGLIVTLLMMVLGMVFGVQALKSTKKKIAIAGLVLNGLMVALIVVFMIS